MKTKTIIFVFIFSFFQIINLVGNKKQNEEISKMINYVDFAHICIVVDDIEQASEFYKKVFEAKLIDNFPHFKNIGFAKCAGFLDNPEELDISIRYLSISNLFIELHQLHSPENIKKEADQKEKINNTAVTLRVKNIDKVFEHIKKQNDITLVNKSDVYKPVQLSKVTADEFYFYDEQLEKNKIKKDEFAKKVSGIKFFSFFDKYGIKWYLVEHGNIDGNNE